MAKQTVSKKEAGKTKIVDTDNEITVTGKAVYLTINNMDLITAVSTLKRVLGGEIKGLMWSFLVDGKIDEDTNSDIWLTAKGKSAYVFVDGVQYICPLSHLEELVTSERSKVTLGKFE